MVDKKEKKIEKKVETKPEKFDLNGELEKLECPNMLKKGLILYIDSNNISIKNKTELDKIFKEFNNLKIGE